VPQGERGAGSRGDFLRAYEDHVTDVYGFFAYRAGSRPDAEDLTQLTFERAWKAWGRFDKSRASVRTWLLAIARNAYVDYRRRDRTGQTVDLDVLAEIELPAEEGPAPHIGPSPELGAAIGRLRQREREVLALRFGGDLQTAEIAEMLGVSVANAQQILSRAVRKLRAEIDPESD
jgi:RNA polymerase sigma factor (sigma-70 family)